MATLPRQRQSGSRLPEYKDYVNFVSAYKNGKKEEDVIDGQPIVLTINSLIASSEAPAITPGKTCESYSEFLGKTKNKKFGPVKPPISSTEKIEFPPKKTVKTEIFLEINNDSVHNDSLRMDAYSVGKTIRKFENRNGQNRQLSRTQSSGSVEAKKKIFEKSVKNQTANVTPKAPMTPLNHNSGQEIKTDLQYVLNAPANNPSNGGNNADSSSENKMKFHLINRETQESTDKNSHIIPVTIFTKKTGSISSNSHHNIFNGSSNSQDITQQFLAHEKTHNLVSEHNQIHLNSINGINESRLNNDIVENLIQQLSKTISQTELPEVRKIEINPEKSNIVDCSPPTKPVINSAGPPPPPPMPVYSNQVSVKLPRMLSTPIQKENNENNIHYHIQKNGSSQSITPKSANVVDGQSTCNNRKYSTLDRKDPLVRKLAYGAMLDMYGAYHDKANNYVAALPQHHVKKENGLKKIIDNIAAQGGLEKLSGRINPKTENE